jgi:hypothetical protein
MGFAVLHIQKPKGNDSGTTTHIERRVSPANADPERKDLNRELIKFPEGVETRTQAIQHRIEKAGIKRKISHNQVRALQIMLSGTPEDMQRIVAEGRLDEWCDDNVKWLQDTLMRDNLVSAVLHMDEKTPHIHATIVPIVTGERRKEREKKKQTETEQGEPTKKKYRKKATDTVRLCADDIMTRENLKYFQDSYAEVMQKYGLQRGIKGSDARHISTPQFYRDLYVKNEDLKEDIEVLQERKEEVYDSMRDLYDRKDEAREKFLDMDNYVRQKEKEVANMKIRLAQLQNEYEPYKAQEDINLLVSIFPKLSANLQMAQLCRGIGLAIDTIKELFTGKEVIVTGKLHSSEHDRYFDVQEVKLQLYKEKSNPDKLHLSLNGQNIFDWFRQKSQKLQETLRTKPKQNLEIGKTKGFKM